MKDFIKKPPMGWNSWDCYGAGVTEDELPEMPSLCVTD